MRFKILSVVFVFVLIFMISAVGDDSLNAATEMIIAGTGFERMVNIEKRYTKDELIREFKEKNRELERYFRAGEFDEIGEYFGPEGIISPDEGDPVMGKRPISEYFQKLKEEDNAYDMKFETKVVIITELTEVLMKTRAEWTSQDRIDTIHEHMDFSYKEPATGDPGGHGTARGGHIRACDI